MKETPVVWCQDAGRSYGRGSQAVVALRDVTLRVLPGDRIAITGRSGSGKSTLAHLVAGLDQPTSGSVSWPALGPRAHLRPGKIGVVFQFASLIPELDVLENVALPLELGGAPALQARERARDALADLELETLARQLPEELSGGQAQRVAVARVLATAPSLVVADEPTGQLDHATAAPMLEVLEAACDALGAALLLTTHDERVAARYSLRWKMVDGSLRSEDGS
ncbi:MAG: ATP-binding cassette domain-containing protein [Candidatus Dormibacteraeota bacterium]|jgi:ABC-type lipoprotein export system ATPase subunit|nr:ATP-binding cassette domain-containing protein [Candidatus Dormibacteraeota bacterium]